MSEGAKTFVIVDNRVPSSFSRVSAAGSCDFSEEATNAQLSAMFTMILSRLLLLSCKHQAWVPVPKIFKAKSINEVVQVANNDGVASLLSTLPKKLMSKQFGTCNYGPATSWQYINSGLKDIFRELQDRKTNEMGGSVLILILTNDKALVRHWSKNESIMTPHHFAVNVDEMQNQMHFFKKIILEIANIIGNQRTVEVRVVMGSIASLPGHGVTGLPAPREGEELGIRDHEIKQLSRFMDDIGGSDQNAPSTAGESLVKNCHVNLLPLVPSALMFEDILRRALAFHSPKAHCTLSFPCTKGMSCKLNLEVSASTLYGSEGLVNLLSHPTWEIPVSASHSPVMLMEVVHPIPRTAVPVNCLEGTILQLRTTSDSSCSNFQVAEGLKAGLAREHNNVSVSALLKLLRQRGSLLLIRMPISAPIPVMLQGVVSNTSTLSCEAEVQRKNLAESYSFTTHWVLIPNEQNMGENGAADNSSSGGFSLMRLVDRESFLIDIGFTEGTSNSSFPVIPATSSEKVKLSKDETEALMASYSLFFEKSLFSTEENIFSSTSSSPIGTSKSEDTVHLHLRGINATTLNEGGKDYIGFHNADFVYNPLSFPSGEIAQQVRAVVEMGEFLSESSSTCTVAKPRKRATGEIFSVESNYLRDVMTKDQADSESSSSTTVKATKKRNRPVKTGNNKGADEPRRSVVKAVRCKPGEGVRFAEQMTDSPQLYAESKRIVCLSKSKTDSKRKVNTYSTRLQQSNVTHAAAKRSRGSYLQKIPLKRSKSYIANSDSSSETEDLESMSDE